MVKTCLTSSALLALAGCGLLADSLADFTETAFDVPVIEEQSFGRPSLQPLSADVSLQGGGPGATLPAQADTTPWGPAFRAAALARAGNLPSVARVAVSDLVFDSREGPLRFDVRVFTRTGRVVGAAAEQPVDSCSFVLATGDANALGDNLTTCLLDWVETNGVPDALDFETTVGPDVAGQGLNADGAFSVTYTQQLQTDQELEVDCEEVALPGDLAQDAQFLDFENLRIRGFGASSTSVLLAAFGAVHAGDGSVGARMTLLQPIAGGQLYFLFGTTELTGEAASFQVAGTVNPVSEPADPNEFARALTEALTSEGAYGRSCWAVIGDAPRTGLLSLEIDGVARYDATGGAE